MKKILTSIVALLAWAGTSMAQTNALSVADILLPNKGDAALDVNFEVDAEDTYTGYQFNIELPSDLEFVMGSGTSVACTKGECHDATHSVTANLDEGIAKVAGLSLESAPLKGKSGLLLSFTIKPKTAGLTAGTTYTGKIKDILIVPVLGDKKTLSDVTFTITISDRIILDENSTTLPTAATGVNVGVNRTINANEWSTICLPFAMTAAQVKAAFGDDVKLGDFAGYETEEEGDDVVGINVKFNSVTAIDANHPYIIKVSSAITSFTADGVDVDAEDAPTVAAVKRTKKQWSEMIGTNKACDIEDLENVLILNGNKFWYVKGTKSFKAFRGYFDFYDVLTGFDAARVGMVFDDATGIQNVNVQNEGEAIYNLNGLRVKTPAKGLYIKNGKKVIIK